MLTTVYRALSRVADALMALGCVALALMMLHVTADVAGKYLFGMPVVGTLETVSHYYMVAAVFLPLAVVQKYRSQIIVDVATQHLAPRRLALVEALVSMLALAFVITLFWQSSVRAAAMTEILEKTNAVHFPIDIWPSRWFVVGGAFGMGAFIFMQMINDLSFASSGRRLFVEDAPAAAH